MNDFTLVPGVIFDFVECHGIKKSDSTESLFASLLDLKRVRFDLLEFTPQAYNPQSSAEGSSIIEKSHISMPISMVTGIFNPSTALALVISIMAGP